MLNSEDYRSLTERKNLKHTGSLYEFISPHMRIIKEPSRLGPGFYNCSLSTLSGPSFQFNMISRFKYDEPLYIIMSRKTSKAKLPGINLNEFKPNLKNSKLKINAKELANKLISIKEKKKELQNDKRIGIIAKIKTKEKRYKMRKELARFSNLATQMYLLLVLLSSAFYLKSKAGPYLRKKKHIFKLINLFFVISLFVAKFKRFLLIKRRKRSNKIIEKYIYRIRNFFERRKILYRSQIMDYAENYLAKPLVTIVLIKLNTLIISIQKYWRHALTIKRNALETKINLFEKFQKLIISKRKNKYQIPNYVIIRYLTEYRKEKFKEYITAIRKYKIQCKKVTNAHNNLYIAMSFDSQIKQSSLPILKLPAKPWPFYTITRKRYKEMIFEALHSRYRWN